MACPNRGILWEIQRQQVRLGGPGGDQDKADLIGWLGDGWEPFAVTWDGDCFDYHLRRWFHPGWEAAMAEESELRAILADHLCDDEMCRCQTALIDGCSPVGPVTEGATSEPLFSAGRLPARQGQMTRISNPPENGPRLHRYDGSTAGGSMGE